jgi:hypothetical protein
MTDGGEVKVLSSSVPTVLIKIKPEDDPRVLVLARDAEYLRKYSEDRAISADVDLTPATEDLSVIAKVKKTLTEFKVTK